MSEKLIKDMKKPPNKIDGKVNPAYHRWYRQTEKGREAKRKANKKYRETEKGKASIARYRSSDKCKNTLKDYYERNK